MSDKKTGGEKRPFAFSRSIRGYNKKDVNNYIAEADAAHCAEIQELELRIAELEASLESERILSEQIRDELEDVRKTSEEELAHAESELRTNKNEYDRKIAELEEKLKASADAAAEYAKRVSEEESLRLAAEKEAKAATEKSDALEALLKEKDEIISSDEEERKRLEDEIGSKDCGRIAASTADEQARLILKNARSEASALRRESELEAEVAREMVRTKAETALRDIYGMIDNAARESIDVILHTVEDAEYETSVIADKINSGNHSATSKVSCIRSELESGIERRIAAIRSYDEGECLDGEMFHDVSAGTDVRSERSGARSVQPEKAASSPARSSKPQPASKRHGRTVSLPFFMKMGNKPSGK